MPGVSIIVFWYMLNIMSFVLKVFFMMKFAGLVKMRKYVVYPMIKYENNEVLLFNVQPIFILFQMMKDHIEFYNVLLTL